MKQKIVMKVAMQSEKDRSKAMQIAVSVQGVCSVSIGKEGDCLVVIGEGVDSVRLAKSLRKKFCFADITTVQKVAPPCSPPYYQPPCPPCNYRPPPPPPCRPYYDYQCHAYDSGPSHNCSIL